MKFRAQKALSNARSSIVSTASDNNTSSRGMKVGEAEITPGYILPAVHVIHTRTPYRNSGKRSDATLTQCYSNSLHLARKRGLHSIAFPTLAVGQWCYSNERASFIALAAVREWIDNQVKIEALQKSDREDSPGRGGERSYQSPLKHIVFCVSTDRDYVAYVKHAEYYFGASLLIGESLDPALLMTSLYLW